MNARPKQVIAHLLLSAFLMALAGTAKAADYVVEFSTATLSSLPPLTASDTITVRNGGTLIVDADATILSLTIGDASSAGTVTYLTSSTLTVAANVTFGANAANQLAMNVGVTTPTNKVAGSFLASGAGSFFSGLGTIEYNGTNQTVTGNIGGGGATIQYKNVILSGSPVTGSAVKTFASGVSIQGKLIIRAKAVPAGASSATYGSLGELIYDSTVGPITTSSTEWPGSLNAKVTINTNNVVILDSDKFLGTGGLVVNSGAALGDNGKTLTVQGNIENNGAIGGKGKLVLGGNSPQLLGSGLGNYGNVTLNSSSVVTLPANALPQPLINGRLIIQAGKLKLPTGSTHHASLLTYGGVDKAGNTTYGPTTSTATVRDDSIFDNTTTGTLTVDAKPVAVVATSGAPPTVPYGTSIATISGTVSSPVGPPNLSLYGDGPVDGEQVVITIASTPAIVGSATLVNGAFSATLNTASLTVGGSFQINIGYPGGINLAGITNNNIATLTVVPKPVTVVPRNASKVYDTADPALLFDLLPPDALVGTDTFTGALSRAAGEAVGLYAITQGTLLFPASYNVTFDTSKTLTIVQKPITITIISTNKTYGVVDVPAMFTYVTNTPLRAGDVFSGIPLRAPGETVGSYIITNGTLTAGPNYAQTFINGNFVINKRDLVVDFVSQSKIYGNVDPSIIRFNTPALAGNPPINPADTFSSGNPSRTSGETVAGSPYLYNGGNLSLGNRAGNYNTPVFNPTNGALTIAKRQVGVFGAGPTNVYGANLPALVRYEGNPNTSASGFITNANTVGGGSGIPTKSAPDTAPTITFGAQGTPTPCSLPGVYSYTVNNDASDANYFFLTPVPATTNLTIIPAVLNVTANNKTKVGDGNLFPFANFDANFNFVCSDTVANSLIGFLSFSNTATTAVSPGVYPISPTGLTPNGLGKYTVSNLVGYLSITAPPATNNVGATSWDGGGSFAWMINNPNGTPGRDPGWTLLNVAGALTLNATPSSPFRLDLVTMSGVQAGRMPKFDPTRPYSWRFVDASGGIANFNSSAFSINYNGAFLFSNPVFGGQFSVRQTGNSLFIDYKPVGFGTPIPTNPDYTVGSTSDPTTLLGDVTTHDVDVLWLQPSSNSITAQQPVTINVNVANLQQPIVGVDAYINFSSAHFVASATGPGAPVVQAGGGVWDTLIFRSWNVGGDLDTIVAVNLTAAAGTSANGTVAKITLTPTRTSTGKSRVVFRADGVASADGSTTVTNDIVPATAGAAGILPARVMTDVILIAVDGAGPSLVNNNMTATQDQPHGNNGVNVKGGGSGSTTEVVRTGGSGATASGPVVIKIPVSDSGVGLAGPPTVVLKNGSNPDIVLTNTPPGGTTNGTYEYRWNVPATVANGTWSVNVSASDTLIPPNTTVNNGAFNLSVNTREITGVVELQSFKGTNRVVNFKIGDNDGASASSVRNYNPNLNFISGVLLNAGAFQDRAGLASKINQTADPLSTYLRYGDVLNLPGLATSLLTPPNNLSAFIHNKLYGFIADQTSLSNLVFKITNPARNIDTYVGGRLSSSTILALGAYNSTPRPAGADAAASAGLLNDFNTIVAGPNIYDQLRFVSVTLSPASLALLPPPLAGPPGGTFVGTLTAAQVMALNRSLLHDAYPEYNPGALDAGTAMRLSQYPGGTDPVLVRGLLQAFDTLTVDSTLWPPPSPPYGPSLYNQTVFLGITLTSGTVNLLNTLPFPTGTQVVLLNQLLLQDGFPGLFVRAPLTPATMAIIQPFNASTFDAPVIADLNALINGGVSIYTPARFAHVAGAIDPNGELGKLLALPSPTPAQLVRENRLLLELGYDAELSKSVLAEYRLVQVLGTTSEVTAKTAWNLRVRRNPLTFSSTLDTVVNFVSDGVPGFTGADLYLRGGDISSDNIINLTDYNLLRASFGTTTASADINGDGVVSIFDYSLMQVNWAKSGDADAR